MKVVLTGTNHSNEDKDIEVRVEFVGDKKEDCWTFEFDKTRITISDLTEVMEFLQSRLTIE